MKVLAIVTFLIATRVRESEAAAANYYPVTITQLPAFGTTVATSLDMTAVPVTVTTVSVTNSFPATNANCQCDCTATRCNRNPCRTTCSTAAACACRNPCGASYQCTVVQTNPPAAFYKIGFSQSLTTSSTTANALTNICTLRVNTALQSGEYVSGSNSVFVAVKVQIVNLANNAQPCNSNSWVPTLSGWYNFTIVPAPSTSTSTTTPATTTTSTTRTTTTAGGGGGGGGAATTSTTKTSTSTTTVPVGATESTTVFLNSTAGIATIAVAAVVGAALLVTALYFAAKACGACPSVPPAAPTMPAAESSIGAKLATTTPAAKPAEAPNYSFYNINNPSTKTQGPDTSNQKFNTAYSRPSPANANSTPTPNFATKQITPVNF